MTGGGTRAGEDPGDRSAASGTNDAAVVREAVRDIARSIAHDRYLAALLAPRSCRDDLIALAAFAGELERIPLLVSETTLGEIRLRWWLDWLEGLETLTPGQEAAATGNPVADRFADVMRRHHLPLPDLRGMIETRSMELYAQPFAEWDDWRGFLDRTEVCAFDLAQRIAGGTTANDTASANDTVSADDSVSASNIGLKDLARAYGAARHLVRLPMLAGRGRWGLPGDDRGEIEPFDLQSAAVRARADAVRATALEQAEQWLAAGRAAGLVPRGGVRRAALPAALTGPYLRVLQDQGDWLHQRVDLSPLNRVWVLWTAWIRG